MISLAEAAARQSISDRISRLRADSPALWGTMSPNGMICHLDDSFLTCFGEKEVSFATGFFQQTVMKFGALYLPAPWPKGVPTRPEVMQGIGGTKPVEFGQDRQRLLATIARFCAPDPKLGQYPHPIFGTMTISQWMRWGYLHVDHHLRQFGL